MMCKITLFFHRNTRNIHRGQSTYVNNLINSLKNKWKTCLIGSTYNGYDGKSKPTEDFFYNILSSYRNSFRYLLEDFFNRRYNSICRVYIAEDLYIAPLILIFSKINGKIFVYRVSDFGREYRYRISKSFKFPHFLYLISRSFEMLLIKVTDYFIVPSIALKNELIEAGGEKSDILYYPYSRAFLEENLLLVEQVRKKLCLSDKIVAIFIGQTDYSPNVEAILNIIQIAKIVENKLPSLQFIVVGKGTDTYSNENIKNISFVGEVDDIDSLLYVSHLGLTPVTVNGGLSIKTVDYLTHGLKVLSTKEGAYGVPENDQLKIRSLGEFTQGISEFYYKVKRYGFQRQVSDIIIKHYCGDYFVNIFLDEFNKKINLSRKC